MKRNQVVESKSGKKEYFIISQGVNVDGSIDGFVLIGCYDRTFTIKKDENPVFFRGFCLPDEIEGPESEELNQIDFNDIVVEFYKEVL